MCNHKWMTFGTDEKGNFRVCSRCNKKVYIITNADKFRAKSDEELAEWLCQALDCDFCKAHMQNIPTHSCCENHESGILKWLQQPAEEDT